MGASIEDHIKVGIAHGHALMNAIEQDQGKGIAMAFLGGLVKAMAEWNLQRNGSRSTYDLFNGLAEQAINPIVAQAAFEADLRDTMRRRMAKGEH